MRNIRQNLLFAFLYNGAGVPIAAGVLYPAFGILLSPVIGAAAMALSSVSVITNALRLRHAALSARSAPTVAHALADIDRRARRRPQHRVAAGDQPQHSKCRAAPPG